MMCPDCGTDHGGRAYDVETVNGEAVCYDLECAIHDRMEPCRACIFEKYVDVETYSMQEYRVALISDTPISELRALGGVA